MSDAPLPTARARSGRARRASSFTITRLTMLDFIRFGMAANELNQREYALELGVTGSAVSEWIAGRRKPAVRYVEGIARLAKIPAAEVLKIGGYLGSEISGLPEAAAPESPRVARIIRLLHELPERDLITVEDVASSLASRVEHQSKRELG